MTPNAEPAPPAATAEELQFQTAETVDNRPRCGACSAVLTDSFYQIGGVNVCASCAEARRANQNLPDSGQNFLRALMYGSGAAFLGWAGWSLVAIVTGFEVGILAIAVGWMVGTAIKKGTGGHTSRKYQIMAVSLTYLAISMSFVPILIADQVKKNRPTQQEQKKAVAPVVSQEARPTGGGFFLGILIVLGVALASPLLGAVFNFPMGLIGVFIVFLGLQRAWALTQPDDAFIAGPFAVESSE